LEKTSSHSTFDMALYEKVIHLVDARPNFKGKMMPRLGELHIVMCTSYT